jgi:hypothetical protein
MTHLRQLLDAGHGARHDAHAPRQGRPRANVTCSAPSLNEAPPDRRAHAAPLPVLRPRLAVVHTHRAPVAMGAPAAPVDLSSEVVASMAPGRFFRDTSAPINSLDFHRTEEWLVCAGALRACVCALHRGGGAKRGRARACFVR